MTRTTDVYRFEYAIELTCSLCARPVATLRARTPCARVVVLRPIRCPVCGGVAVASDAMLVRVPLPVPKWGRQKRGRPPKRLQAPAA